MIVIIDDDYDNSYLLGKIVDLLKQECLRFENGTLALNYLISGNADLILCDLNLPDVDGFDLVRKFREIPHLYDIPIVAISAFDEKEKISKAFESGFTDYVIKPFLPKDLMTKIKGFLNV